MHQLTQPLKKRAVLTKRVSQIDSQNPQCGIIGAGASVTAVDRGLQWQKSVDEYPKVDRTFWKFQSN